MYTHICVCFCISNYHIYICIYMCMYVYVYKYVHTTHRQKTRTSETVGDYVDRPVLGHYGFSGQIQSTQV